MPESKIARQLFFVMPVLSVLVIASFALAAWSFWSSHEQACEARDASLNVMHDVLRAAQVQTDANPLIAAASKRQSDEFVTRALARINQARC
jgi:predicted negative regulator of RcsB-dependent stress response